MCDVAKKFRFIYFCESRKSPPHVGRAMRRACHVARAATMMAAKGEVLFIIIANAKIGKVLQFFLQTCVHTRLSRTTGAAKRCLPGTATDTRTVDGVRQR